MNKPKFYITTAIAYTSKKPHIGNTYEIILSDAIARFKRRRGYDVFFLTGTDEHGQKIEDAAKESNIRPKQYVDRITGEIKDIWNLMNTSYNKFIRTTDVYHEKAVQKIFKKFYDQGDIYKGHYEGWYCTPCESFFTDTQLVEGKCPDCGREVKQAKEEAYFFKMSKYQKQLEQYIEENPNFIVPESRKKEMINNFIKPGLQDLCVSRTSFSWGIPVEFDPKHVVYVWIDALSNYITALGYNPDNKEELYNKYWPADVHVIGKDILRFHTIYWPIMLMALGEPLPKQVFGHPWLLSGTNKMSKSIGNVMYADDLVKEFGVDAVRYYVLSEMPYGADGSITYENIIAKYNAELANMLGNLVNRTIAMAKKYFDGKIFVEGIEEEIDGEYKQTIEKAVKSAIEKMEEYKTSESIDSVWEIIRRSNKYIDETMPWVLAKDEQKADRLKRVLYNLVEAIRIIAELTYPIMPETSERIFRQINISQIENFENAIQFGQIKDDINVGDPEVLFERMDEKEKMEEITKKNLDVGANCVRPSEAPTNKQAENLITIDDVDKVHLKVAKIIKAEKVENADKLLKLEINVGNETRTIVSGIAKYYTCEELIGKSIVVITNLKPAKLRGIESNGMLLAAGEDPDVKLVTIDGDIAAGTEVC